MIEIVSLRQIMRQNLYSYDHNISFLYQITKFGLMMEYLKQYKNEYKNEKNQYKIF